MSNKPKSPLDDVKTVMFGGLHRPDVERLLDNATKEAARLAIKVDSSQAELTRAQNEFESRASAEAILRSQFEHLREDTDAMRARYEEELAQLRQALAEQEAESLRQPGFAQPIADTSELEAQIERLRFELESANGQLEEFRILQAEVEALRYQLSNASSSNEDRGDSNVDTTFFQMEIERLKRELEELPHLHERIADLQGQLAEAQMSSSETSYGTESNPDVSLLQLEIERLKGELNTLPELHEQIASLQGRLMDTENGGELERANSELERAQAEIERLSAEVTNVPGLLNEIESLRAQIAGSPTAAADEELQALRNEVERLHERQSAVPGGPIDLDRTLIEARRILDDARNEAERERDLLIEAAHHHAEEIVRRAQRQFSTESWEIEKIRLERRRYLSMFKALLNRHMHEVEELETEPTSSDIDTPRNQFPTIGTPDGEPPVALRSIGEGSDEFRSPFSYPQADEPFHA